MGWRFLFQILGNGGTVAIALTFFMRATKLQPTGILNRDGYFAYSIMAIVLMVAAIFISTIGTHNRIKTLRQPPAKKRSSLAQIARDVYASLSNGAFIVVTFAGMFGGMAIGLVAVLGTYLGTYFWRFTPQQLSVLGLAALIAATGGTALAPVLSRWLEKKRAYILAAVASLAINNVTMAMKLMGVLPPDGSQALLVIFFVSTAIGLTFSMASFILVLSMIADVVEDSELKTGRRSEGLFSASMSFVNKATTGLGVLAAGVMLDAVHFPAHAAAATIDPAIPRHLALIYMPTQIVLFGIGIAILLFYRIDRSTHESNLARLAEAAALAEESEEGTLVRDAVARPDTVPAAPVAAPGV